jgi:hypothetical protein
MSIERVKEKLNIVKAATDRIVIDLPGIAKRYTDFPDMATQALQDNERWGSCPSLLREAEAEYERMAVALRRASEIYQDRVLPNLTASGVASLGTEEASTVAANVLAISPALRPILDFVHEHLVRETFSQAIESGDTIKADTEEHIESFRSTFVGPAANLTLLQTGTSEFATLLEHYITELNS